MADFGGSFIAGARFSADEAWRLHTARLQNAAETREQAGFDDRVRQQAKAEQIEQAGQEALVRAIANQPMPGQQPTMPQPQVRQGQPAQQQAPGAGPRGGMGGVPQDVAPPLEVASYAPIGDAPTADEFARSQNLALQAEDFSTINDQQAPGTGVINPSGPRQFPQEQPEPDYMATGGQATPMPGGGVEGLVQMPRTEPATTEAVLGAPPPAIGDMTVAPEEATPQAAGLALQRNAEAQQQAAVQRAAALDYQVQARYQTAIAMAQAYPVLARRVAMVGGGYIDVPSFNQAYSEAMQSMNQQLINTGQVDLLKNVIAAQGYDIKNIDSAGNYTLTAWDAERQIEHEFGITGAQAEVFRAIGRETADNGGFIPEQIYEQYSDLFDMFPWAIEHDKDANGRDLPNMLANDEGVQLSTPFLGMVQGMLDSTQSASELNAQTRQYAAQRQEEYRATQWVDKFDTRLARFKDEMPEGAAERFAAEWNQRNPDEPMTGAEVADRWAGMVYTPQERLALDQAKMQFNSGLVSQRQADRIAATSGIRMALAEFGVANRRQPASRGGRRASTPATMRGVAAIDTVAQTSEYLYAQLQNYRNPSWKPADGPETEYINLPAEYQRYIGDRTLMDALKKFHSQYIGGQRGASAVNTAALVFDRLDANGAFGVNYENLPEMELPAAAPRASAPAQPAAPLRGQAGRPRTIAEQLAGVR